MKGKHKPFDKKLYEAFDGSAKQAVCRYLLRKGHEVIIPKEDYGADLYHIDKAGRNVYHEVEVSRCYWSGDKFNSHETSIPERKIRLVEKGYPYLLHWLLNMQLSHAVVTNMNKYCKEEFLREFSNQYIDRGEFFYKIPLKYCRIVTL